MTVPEVMALVDRSLFATVGFADESGFPGVRRVFCVWHRGLGRHLISTNTSSAHVQCLLRDSRACLYFSDDATFEGVCLSGHIAVRTERAYRELLWNDGDEKYYPAGIDDPDYCILEFTAESGRYYRFDGKGELTQAELAGSDCGEYLNGYAETHR